jgi:hypothetical protein
MNRFPPSPGVSQKDRFEFFSIIFGNIHSSRYTTGAVDTGSRVVELHVTYKYISFFKFTFTKIRNDTDVIFRGLGKMIHEKNLKQKMS